MDNLPLSIPQALFLFATLEPYLFPEEVKDDSTIHYLLRNHLSLKTLAIALWYSLGLTLVCSLELCPWANLYVQGHGDPRSHMDAWTHKVGVRKREIVRGGCPLLLVHPTSSPISPQGCCIPATFFTFRKSKIEETDRQAQTALQSSSNSDFGSQGLYLADMPHPHPTPPCAHDKQSPWSVLFHWTQPRREQDGEPDTSEAWLKGSPFIWGSLLT
jgi:hypothetical protein